MPSRFRRIRLPRLGLSARILLPFVAAVTLAVAALEAWNARERIAQAEAERYERLQRALSTLEGVVGALGAGFRREGDTLLAGGAALNGRNDVVDILRGLGAVATIFVGDQRIATSVQAPDGTRAIGTRLAQGPAYDASIRRGETYIGENTILGRPHRTIYKPIRDAAGTQLGLLFVGIPLDDRGAILREVAWAGVVTAATLLLVAGIALIVTLRFVLRPLRRVTERVAAVAAGDTAAPVPHGDRGDEIGRLARAVEDLRIVAGEAMARQAMLDQLPMGVMVADARDDFRIAYMNPSSRELLQRVAALLPVSPGELLGRSVDVLPWGDATRREALAEPARLPLRTRIALGEETLDITVAPVRDRSGGYVAAMLCWSVATKQARLADGFERDVGSVVDGLSAAVEEVQRAAEGLAETARASRALADGVAQAGQGAGMEVQAVAASAEQLAASVAEISRRVADGAALARGTAQEARQTNETVQGLTEATTRIGDVAALIGDIAGRTNLLALNATIEAARAGDAGKGFAVVASEVKALASQTAKATEEIGAQIGAVQASANAAIEALRGIVTSVGRMEEATAAISAAVEEQGAVTREIAATAGRVAEGTAAVVERIGEVKGGAGATEASAGGMRAAADAVATRTAELRERAGHFLSAVRAA